MTTIVRRLLFFIALIAIWEIIYRIDLFQTRMFPSPLLSFVELYRGFFETGILTAALTTSLGRISLGFALAVIIGSILGIILATSKLADETLGSLVVALQSVPSIVWLPLALVMFQGGSLAILFVIILGGTWPMTMNMRMGIKNVQPLLIRAARTMGYKGLELVWKVLIPASIPSALTGVRLAWAFGWRALMAAELLGRGGLGRTLLDARDFFNMELVIAIMIIIAVIGLIVEYLIFNPIERKVLQRWGYSK
ncbi:ABC transporter (permease) (NSB type) [Alkalihalophilus pseudofirmus OF4]|uniref:ABC transporter (Permease) (NSB type) n=2 Tax=Alkalihalophilus pseudofirmus TaxID=79885 RepID=D3FVU3_ALKPO|nr:MULTISPECIES: ABC transporter permease [Alkalihalophilus]ADC50375.1 ABC transporter (permease) (NSB type) [Alkalihalophilus pseudofirmus OF4]MDV2886921.1 ABC transporter permease [Alkalihalophilus pseudofirmus]MED1600654.1 ABC transporter permease [Alkalihalophilus marmarensis]OLS36611.1 ABC transporter permease [Alkalihalophilus pseudofirmus]WEG17658.1 ABC transporter permease [Alkalihalophilus pseudofirmus]